jgi:hypothetical protein
LKNRSQSKTLRESRRGKMFAPIGHVLKIVTSLDLLKLKYSFGKTIGL